MPYHRRLETYILRSFHCHLEDGTSLLSRYWTTRADIVGT
jgi:hypothetical protein